MSIQYLKYFNLSLQNHTLDLMKNSINVLQPYLVVTKTQENNITSIDPHLGTKYTFKDMFQITVHRTTNTTVKIRLQEAGLDM